LRRLEFWSFALEKSSLRFFSLVLGWLRSLQTQNEGPKHATSMIHCCAVPLIVVSLHCSLNGMNKNMLSAMRNNLIFAEVTANPRSYIY
jgi:hypothetical protein